MPAGIRLQLGLLYRTPPGWVAAATPWLRAYQLRHSEALGRRYDSPASAAAVPGFIQVRAIATEEGGLGRLATCTGSRQQQG